MSDGDSNNEAGGEAGELRPAGANQAKEGWFGIPIPEMHLARRIAIAIGVGLAIFAGVVHLNAVYGRKFYNVTGPAKWIWAPVEIKDGDPLAFFAARDFDLPPNRYFTKIKIIGDPEYTLFFNGRELAGRRFTAGSVLDVYDVSSLSKDGPNRIVVGARARRGVGGLLVSVDISPELENFFATDASWKIFTTWDPQLPLHDVGVAVKPLVYGEPPFGRWNYLHPRVATIDETPLSAVRPLASFRYTASEPVTRIVGGTPIVTTEHVPAVAYDFGPIAARLRLVRSSGIDRPALVRVRFANARSELLPVEGEIRPYEFAAGETAVADMETRHFRYAAVYGGGASLEALVRK